MNWTNMNSRTLCFVLGANTAFPVVPKRIHTAVLQHMKVALQKSCWIGCFLQVIKNQVFQLPVLVVHDLSTGAVMAMQSTKDSSVVTVGADAGNVGTH